MTLGEFAAIAAGDAESYIAEGFPEDQAVDMAIRRNRHRIRSIEGLGQDVTDTPDPSLFQKAQSEVKSISSLVSPWLWILSVGGFLMGIASKYEISKMYGSYKRMKKQLY